MTVSLALLWSTVVGHCLARCRATPGRCFTSSPWTYPKSTVLTRIAYITHRLFHNWVWRRLHKHNWLLVHKVHWAFLFVFQAEEGSLPCVLLAWEWRRDTTMWGKWLRRLSSCLCPTIKLMWPEWSWLVLPTSRLSSANLTCLTQ